jgi:hypothetical protein
MMSPSSKQADRPAFSGFRADMADAEAAGRAGEPAVGDQSYLVAHALAVKAAVVDSISRMPGTAFGALIADHQNLAFLVIRFVTALKQSSSESKQRAGPVNFSFDIPATFTIAPSSARLPLRPTTPPVLVIGLLAGCTTS